MSSWSVLLILAVVGATSANQFALVRPKAASYGESNYKKVIESTPPPDVIAVLSALPSAESRLEFQKGTHTNAKQPLTLGGRCARLWTADGAGAVYSTVKRIIIRDDLEELKKWAPYIKCLEDYIGNRNGDDWMQSPHQVVYRGSKMGQQQRATYEVNTFVVMASFFSTSFSLDLASKFTGPSGCILELHVPPHYKWAREVTYLSHFWNEKEALFAPYTTVEVLSNTPPASGKPARVVLRVHRREMQLGQTPTVIREEAQLVQSGRVELSNVYPGLASREQYQREKERARREERTASRWYRLYGGY